MLPDARAITEKKDLFHPYQVLQELFSRRGENEGGDKFYFSLLKVNTREMMVSCMRKD